MQGNAKIIAIFGKAGSGKDTIQKWLVKNMADVHSIVSCTTRPPREYEENGKDYFFLTNEEFGEKVLNGQMLEATCFRDWMYGTSLQSIDRNKVNIGVFNIQGIECLLQDPRLDILPIYIDVDDKTRLLRQLKREENPDVKEIVRRYGTDEKDFAEIPFFALRYENKDKRKFTEILSLIKSTNFLA